MKYLSNMQINSHILKLQGRSELPQEIEEGHNYHVSLSGSINKVEYHDNEDGTWNKVYTFKPILVELLDKMGKTLKLKDPRKNSSLIRSYLFKCYHGEGYIEPFEDVYDAFTKEVIGMTPSLLREAIKRLQK